MRCAELVRIPFFYLQGPRWLQTVKEILLNEARPHCIVCFSPVTAQFAGEDPVVALEAALQFEDTRESMQAFCVGQYMEVPNGFSVGFIPDVLLQAFIFPYFIPYSLTRKQSPLQT